MSTNPWDNDPRREEPVLLLGGPAEGETVFVSRMALAYERTALVAIMPREYVTQRWERTNETKDGVAIFAFRDSRRP